jgi:hypothetical protein
MLWASGTWTVITINSIIDFVYASNMVFYKIKPDEHDNGPLYGGALKFSKEHPDLMIIRRLYAIEAWLVSVPAGVGITLTPFLWYLTIMAWPL